MLADPGERSAARMKSRIYSERMRPSLPPIKTIDENPDEYVAYVEELEHAAELLLHGGLAEERMALVIIDSLAERLLYQHAEQCFRASDAPIAASTDPFPAARRQQTLGDFRRRVQLAQTDEKFFLFIDPILNELDAEIFRIAHDYRGPGYHRGEHNPTLAGPLGCLYAQAVGRAFSRSTSHSFSALPPEAVHKLKRFRPGDTDPNLNWSRPRDATGPITQAITNPLVVEAKQLARKLRADSDRRLQMVGNEIDGLRRGLPDERIAELIEAAQHWAQHRGDAELHELAREERALEHQAEEDEDDLSDGLKRRLLENKLATIRRMEELKKQTEIQVDLGTFEMLRSRSDRLTEKAAITPLLHAYREVDGLLQILEMAIGWAARAWEQRVEQAIDEARGK